MEFDSAAIAPSRCGRSELVEGLFFFSPKCRNRIARLRDQEHVEMRRVFLGVAVVLLLGISGGAQQRLTMLFAKVEGHITAR
jgi:hypothetical protein